MSTFSQERPRVLIVDDQENWREALSDMLGPVYEIETAANYEDAKRRLWQRAFHVLVTDQRLMDPDITNIEGILLLDEVAKLWDGTQAIIVTGYPTFEAAKEALRGRGAYDYLLKHPEEGGAFQIREYRARVKEAAEKAMEARQKAITLDFSVPALVIGLTYDQITKTLFAGDATIHDAQEDVRRLIHRLLFHFQPLAYGKGRAWLLEADQICEILCWSRGYGKAALIRIGREQCSLNVREVEWLRKSWRLVRNEELVFAPLIGISYVVEDMIFEDFAALGGTIPYIEPPTAATTMIVRQPPSAMAWLLVLNGPHRGYHIPLTDSVTIGRGALSCEVVLDDITVSRQHAKMRLENSRFYICDLGSINGSFVNGVRVIKQELRDRDEIRIGNTIMLFVQAVSPEDLTVEAKRRLQEFDLVWDQLTRSVHHD